MCIFGLIKKLFVTNPRWETITYIRACDTMKHILIRISVNTIIVHVGIIVAASSNYYHNEKFCTSKKNTY